MSAEVDVVGRASGLDEAEVQQRVLRGEVNDVPKVPSRTTWQIVRANVFTPFNALLGGLLVVILLVGPFQDALFGVVLVANAGIGIVQELRAKRTLDRLAVLTAPRIKVVRAGTVQEVPVSGVVLDDVLELGPGDQVVVDGVVIASRGLEVDESLISGESDPLLKERGDQVLSGSFVAAGSGRYRASRVGSAAYAATLAQEARRFTLVNSELRNGINRIVILVTWALIPTAALLFSSQLRGDSGLHDALRGSVAGTVAMVPEGLVLLTSVAFAAAVVRLGRRRVLVQELPSVEGLARVDVLCIDKTGTLTEGRLEVERIEGLTSKDEEAVNALGALAAGDPNPNSTLRAIAARCPPPTWTLAASVPFSSVRKWSAASFDQEGTWVLGAPELLVDGSDGSAEALWARTQAEAAAGRRVLLLQRSEERVDGERLPEAREPVALVLLRDLVRADAAGTLRYFADQGVAVKVISGDHPATVGSVAHQVGVLGANEAVDARDLPEGEELAGVLDRRAVFGRVTPQQKRSMVHALQSRGHTVAMTGDGVNDVLALKDSDIGIAMGSGSEATRAVAQLVLLDGRFASLPSVVGEGRRVLANIERTANLFLTKTVYAMLLALAVGVLSFAFPFLPRQLTLISALTIGIPGLFLALGPNPQRARPGFVTRVLWFAVPAGIMAAAATLAAYILVKNELGSSLAEARTTATIVLGWIGLLILTEIARPLTWRRILLILSMGAAFLAAFLLPAARHFFALDPPPPIVWLAAVGIGAMFVSVLRLFLPDRRPMPSESVGTGSADGAFSSPSAKHDEDA